MFTYRVGLRAAVDVLAKDLLPAAFFIMQTINFIRVPNENIRAIGAGDEVFDITRYVNCFEFYRDGNGNATVLIRSSFDSKISATALITNISFEGIACTDFAALEVAVNGNFFSNIP